jgi:hypothetical protein
VTGARPPAEPPQPLVAHLLLTELRDASGRPFAGLQYCDSAVDLADEGQSGGQAADGGAPAALAPMSPAVERRTMPYELSDAQLASPSRGEADASRAQREDRWRAADEEDWSQGLEAAEAGEARCMRRDLESGLVVRAGPGNGQAAAAAAIAPRPAARSPSQSDSAGDSTGASLWEVVIDASPLAAAKPAAAAPPQAGAAAAAATRLSAASRVAESPRLPDSPNTGLIAYGGGSPATKPSHLSVLAPGRATAMPDLMEFSPAPTWSPKDGAGSLAPAQLKGEAGAEPQAQRAAATAPAVPPPAARQQQDGDIEVEQKDHEEQEGQENREAPVEERAGPQQVDLQALLFDDSLTPVARAQALADTLQRSISNRGREREG